jgi:hypothetical protein
VRDARDHERATAVRRATGTSRSTPTRGSGTVLGPFMGESFGLGPAILWTPEFLKGRGAVVLKWLHDISNTNRLNGDWAQVALSYRF